MTSFIALASAAIRVGPLTSQALLEASGLSDAGGTLMVGGRFCSGGSQLLVFNASSAPTHVSILAGPTPYVTATTTLPTTPITATAVDVDGDGIDELVVAAATTKGTDVRVSSLCNACSKLCPKAAMVLPGP